MIIDLKSLIKVHEEQITSRSLSKKLGVAAPVTLLAFDSGETISNETSPLVKMVEVLSGELCVTLGEESFTVTAGEMVVVAPQLHHSFRALSACKVLQIELPNEA